MIAVKKYYLVVSEEATYKEIAQVLIEHNIEVERAKIFDSNLTS